MSPVIEGGGYVARRSMPQRSISLAAEPHITGGKALRAAGKTPQRHDAPRTIDAARCTGIKQTKRKTCAARELV
ncbi:hypothetical protein [Paraburkholderia dilworthii]|uniref:hypothetical protein n=1 Tax=Paraburkholderia dilworthii TaxID=948106 RepID=UPI0004090988|nr:hypothetical protein [Paraburkholderia dilworthii]